MIKDLCDQVVSSIDIDESEDRVLITLENGKQYVIEHRQDCCESVRIVSNEQDMLLLKDRKIIDADVYYSSDDNDCGSETDTVFTFRTDKNTVVLKWYGESNGYYSETADIYQIS